MGTTRTAEQIIQEKEDFCKKVTAKLKKHMKDRGVQFEECDWWRDGNEFGIWTQCDDSLCSMEISYLIHQNNKRFNIEEIEKSDTPGHYDWKAKHYILDSSCVRFTLS